MNLFTRVIIILFFISTNVIILRNFISIVNLMEVDYGGIENGG